MTPAREAGGGAVGTTADGLLPSGGSANLLYAYQVDRPDPKTMTASGTVLLVKPQQ